MSSAKYSMYTRLSFGVPLEDVFPSEQMDPTLKKLFIATHEKVLNENLSIQEILRSNQGSVDDRLYVKEKLESRQLVTDTIVPTGVLFWVVRHFLGLLPIPLLPRYTNGRDYSWWKLSELCKFSFQTSTEDCNGLINKIVADILQLPKVHLVLLFALLNFLRNVAIIPFREPRVNKTTMYVLVKYFSSSIFVRPFRPGHVTKLDQHYYPLMLYLLIKWPEIRLRCNLEIKDFICPEPNNIYFMNDKMIITRGYNYRRLKQVRNNSSQTLDVDIENSDSLTRIISPFYDQVEFLRDTSCQTEASSNSKNNTVLRKTKPNQCRCSCCAYGSHYDKIDGEDNSTSEEDEIAKKINTYRHEICCCTYSTNYETNKTSMVTNKKNVDDNIHIYTEPDRESETMLLNYKRFERNPEPKSTPEYTKVSKNVPVILENNLKTTPVSKFIEKNKIFSKSSQQSETWSLATLVSSGDEYIYDDYSCFEFDNQSTLRLIYDDEEDSHSYDNTATASNVFEDIKESNADVIERISKIGWTYTSPKSDSLPNSAKTQDDQPSHSNAAGWMVPKKEMYTLNFNEKGQRDEEEKEELSHEAKETNADIPTSPEVATISLHESPLNTSRSRKSILSISKIKSKLDFLKFLRPTKIKARKSVSCEQMPSKVKYKKIGSASSTM